MIVSEIPRELADLARADFVRSAAPDWAESAAAPLHVRRVTLRPGEITAEHNHHDLEVWVVLDGVGEVCWDGQRRGLAAGDSVYLPPLAPHTLRNLSADRPLSFFSMWWENLPALASVHAERVRRQVTERQGRPLLLLPSFPTPNGELHLGHLSGPFLNADVCRRALLAAGERAHLLLGTVGHQSQVSAAARAQGLTFHELAERNTDAIVDGLAAAGIGWDVFVRPSEPAYPALATSVFTTLRDKEVLVRRTEPASFCAPCGTFLFEAFVAGRCPHCGSDQTAGIECELCALPYDDRDLVDPSCVTCGAAATQRPLTRYFMPLEPLRDRLTDYLRGAAMHGRLRAYTERVLARRLPDLPVTIPADHGIPIHVEDAQGPAQQRMYSAFELTARFLVALDGFAGGWEDYARRENPRTVLFFGFDNAFLRAFAFPSVLGAFTDALALPEALVCNDFYLLDGEKFSTGRRHAVWARQAVTPANADQVRLYLAATAPDVRRRDFTARGYAEFVTVELIGAWQRWLDDVGARLARDFGSIAPEAGGWHAEAERFYGQIEHCAAAVTQDYLPGRFKPRAVVAAACALVWHAEDFAEVGADAPAGSGIARTCAALELMAARTLAMAVGPVAPDFGTRMAAALGVDDLALEPTPRWVPPGTKITFGTDHFRPDTTVAGHYSREPADRAHRRDQP